jgi:branched-chain amino acid transport system substrate-binding protein
MIKYKFSKFEEIPSPVGVAQAYDATYLIKLAIDSARSTDRVLIRNALENLTNYDGAIRDYIKPFSQDSHDALTENDVLFVNIRPNGTLIPIR